MTDLFAALTVGGLALPNRLMRSATAERLTDPATGAPSPALGAMYAHLARGGVGLIVTGHAYVDRSGKAHAEMAGIDSDALIAPWREVVRPAQDLGARVMMQVNHAGANCDPAVTPEPLSPSGVPTPTIAQPRTMTDDEIVQVVMAFGQAARRARAAGFDGVQLHGAHGYLASQFLAPGTNRREDRWGGDPARRAAFLVALVAEARRQVGADYPVWVKLGVAGAEAYGPSVNEGAQAARALKEAGADAIEISNAMGVPEGLDDTAEARYLPFAQAVRAAVGTDYPLALVNGLRTRATMQALLDGGVVQVISLCRPLIADPGFPHRMAAGEADGAACVSCSNCWPKAAGEGVDCHNAAVRRQLGRPALGA